MLAAECGHGEIQVLEWRCCRLSCVPLVMEGFVAAKRGWGGKGRWGAALTISPGAPVMPCCPRAPTSPCEWRRRHSGTGPRVPQGCGMDGSLEGPRLWVQPRTHLVSWATFASRLARQALQEQRGSDPMHGAGGTPCPGVISAVGLLALILTACPRCPGGPGRPGCPAVPCREKVHVRRMERGTGRRTPHVGSSPSHPGCPACRPCHRCQADPVEREHLRGVRKGGEGAPQPPEQPGAVHAALRGGRGCSPCGAQGGSYSHSPLWGRCPPGVP